jgi:hypothetical protein
MTQPIENALNHQKFGRVVLLLTTVDNSDVAPGV